MGYAVSFDSSATAVVVGGTPCWRGSFGPRASQLQSRTSRFDGFSLKLQAGWGTIGLAGFCGEPVSETE